MAARKVPKLNGQSKYIITTTVEHLSDKWGGIGYAGKLQCTNILGTEYILYDSGVNSHKHKGKDEPNRVIVRRELAAILYVNAPDLIEIYSTTGIVSIQFLE